MRRLLKIPPAPPLRPYISFYTLLDFSDRLPEEQVLRFCPWLTLGFSFLCRQIYPLFISTDRFRRVPLPQAFINPCQTRPYQVHLRGGFQQLTVHFHFGKFVEFFGWPANRFTDTIVSLEETDQSEVFADIYHQIRKTENCEKAIEMLDAKLMELLPAATRSNPALEQALQLVINSKGIISPAEVVHKTKMSERHLRRLFLQYIGLPPQSFIRFFRFYIAKNALLTNKRQSIRDIALTHGFYDPAHLIHEFQWFTGTSPSRYLEQNQDLNDQLSWDALQRATAFQF